MSKANAREWRQEQAANEQKKESLERQGQLLWYAANKRKNNFPCEVELRSQGFSEVASKLAQAYRLIEDADRMFREATENQGR